MYVCGCLVFIAQNEDHCKNVLGTHAFLPIDDMFTQAVGGVVPSVIEIRFLAKVIDTRDKGNIGVALNYQSDTNFYRLMLSGSVVDDDCMVRVRM